MYACIQVRSVTLLNGYNPSFVVLPSCHHRILTTTPDLHDFTQIVASMGFIFGNMARALSALAAVLPFASAVPFGLQIYSCTLPGVIAPGFDDGPWIYSEDILDR